MAFSALPVDDVSAFELLLSDPSPSLTAAILPLLIQTNQHQLLSIKKQQKPCNMMNSQLHRELMGIHSRQNLFLNTSLKSRSLYCLDVLAHHDCVQALEFSEDGQYFVSASLDMCLFLWKMDDTMTNKSKPKPTAIHADFNSNAFCLAFGPENDHVFSGSDEKIIIHDVLRNEPYQYVAHESMVLSLGLQPFSFGNVFASGCSEGKLRLFDLRCSTNNAAFENARHLEGIRSVMFSPVDETLIAVSGSPTGTELIDVRQPEKCLLSFPSTYGSMNARFNAKGNRLLCLENRESPVIYDLSNSNKIQLEAKGYRNFGTPKSACFAGKDDELAVAGSNDHNVFIWSVPDSPDSEIVSEPLLTLQGHRSIVNHVR